MVTTPNLYRLSFRFLRYHINIAVGTILAPYGISLLIEPFYGPFIVWRLVAGITLIVESVLFFLPPMSVRFRLIGDAFLQFINIVTDRNRTDEFAGLLARQPKLPDESYNPGLYTTKDPSELSQAVKEWLKELHEWIEQLDPKWVFFTNYMLRANDRKFPTPLFLGCCSRPNFLKFTDRVGKMETIDHYIEEQLTTLRDYADRSKIEGLKQAVVILKRYNLAWQASHLDHPSELPYYVKSVTNPKAEQIMKKAFSQAPVLYRLAFIKQLSTVNYRRKLDAAHPRLPHALGMSEVAAMLLEAIQRPLDNENIPKKQEFSKCELIAVVLFSLIHDAYHGPMGHSLELMGSLLREGDLVRLDKDFLKVNLTADGDMAPLVDSVTVSENEKQDVFHLLNFFIDPNSDRNLYFNKYYLKDIVDSQLDADRVDYLLRDGLHFGEPVVDKNSWIDVLMSARVVKEPDETTEEGQSRLLLAYPLEYKSRVEHLLSLRHRYYKEYYEATDKLILDDMICHMFYYHLDMLGVFNQWAENSEEELLSANIRNDFMKLTDENVFQFLIELEKPNLDYPWYPNDMLTDILTHRHYQYVHAFSYDEENLKIIRNQARGLWIKIQSEYGSQSDSARRRMTVEKKLTMVKGVIGDNDESVFDVLVGLFVFCYYDSFDYKVRFERKLWQKMLDDPDDKDLKDAWHRQIHDNYGSFGQHIIEQSLQYPPIHITLPTDSETEYYAHYVRDEQSHEEDDHPRPPRVLFYDRQGKSMWEHPDISYAVHSFKPSMVILSAQYDLCSRNELDLKTKFSKAFAEILLSLEWLSEKV